MQVKKLDHVNIRTTQLDTMINWYTNVLGLENGYRPRFTFEGAWLYASGSVIIHLVQIDEKNTIGSESSLKLEHFALQAAGAIEFEATLNKASEKFKRIELAEINAVLYNVWDPDGNHIHIDFPMDE